MSVGRETSHFVVETVDGRWFIVSALCSRDDCQVISIDNQTGKLLYTAQHGVDLFSSPRKALQEISQGNKIVKAITKCAAIIGYMVIGPTGHLLVATKVRTDMVLPPGHRVNTITETQWIKIPLRYPEYVSTKVESKNMELLSEFPIDGLHYYCETLDLTRHYPSAHKLDDYEKEFCFNDFLSQPFAQLGLRRWCCILMEGMANAKVTPSRDAPNGVIIGLITRKSCFNAGTRYNARGLNTTHFSPGNEYECELLLWRETQGVVNWSSYVIRRGTVPLHWKSEINNAVTDADIQISDKPYENIDTYWKRLLDRYGSTAPIKCVNLLRFKSVHATEGTLAEAFEESLKVLKKLMTIDVNIVNYDWHQSVKTVGLNKSIENLWAVLATDLRTMGITSGIIRIQRGRIVDLKIYKKQHGVLRINCADSLDRTNLAAFFACFQTIAEQCRCIGVSLCGTTHVHSSPQTTAVTNIQNCRFISNPVLSTTSSSAAATTSTTPASRASVLTFPMLGRTIDEVKRCYDDTLVTNLAELFVTNGDVCSMLYTHSPAMHTSALREFAPHLPAAQSNTKIIVQRRFQNVLLDKHKQTQYEMFLGINKETYFPTTHSLIANSSGLGGGGLGVDRRLRLATAYPAFIFKSLPSELQSMASATVNGSPCLSLMGHTYGQEEMVLLNGGTQHCWVCPRDHDFVACYIFLPFYCRVTELSITVRHGLAESFSPAKMDVYVGTHIDDCVLGYQGLQLPRCEDNTKLLYSLPTQISGTTHFSRLYNFVGRVASNRMRVVHITFHGVPPSAFMTLGQIQVYGMIEEKQLSPEKIKLELKNQTTKKLMNDVLRFNKDLNNSLATVPPPTLPITATVPPPASGSSSQPILADTDSTQAEANDSSSDAAKTEAPAPEVEVYKVTVAGRKRSGTIAGNFQVTFDNETNMLSPVSSPTAEAALKTNASSSSLGAKLFGSQASNLSHQDLGDVDGDDDVASPTDADSGDDKKTFDKALISDYFDYTPPPSHDMIRDLNPNDHAYTLRVAERIESLSQFVELMLEREELQANKNTSNQTSSHTTSHHLNLLEWLGSLSQQHRVKHLLDCKVQYVKFLNKLSRRSPRSPLTFMEVLELELARLILCMTAQARDNALVENGCQVIDFDPNRFVIARDEKVESAIRDKLKQNSCTRCTTPLKIRKMSCRYCRKTFCKACISPHQKSIVEFMWDKPQRLCIDCVNNIDRQMKILQEIVRYSEFEERLETLTLSSPYEAFFTQMYPPANITRSYSIPSAIRSPSPPTESNSNEVSLAEFPSGAILSSVDTGDASAPIESILFPHDLLPLDEYWFAPPETESVNVIIVLPCSAMVSKLVLLTDALGYHAEDLPTIDVSVADRLPHFVNKGSWNLVSSADQPSGETKTHLIPPDTRLEYTLPVTTNQNRPCRLIQLKLALPTLRADASDSEATSTSRKLHLGRLLVFGHIVPEPHIPTFASSVAVGSPTGTLPLMPAVPTSPPFLSGSSPHAVRPTGQVTISSLIANANDVPMSTFTSGANAPSSNPYLLILPPRDQNTYENIMSIKDRLQRIMVKSESVRYSKEQNALDVSVDANQSVSGFSYTAKYGADGSGSQIREIQVSLLVVNEKNELVAQVIAGTFLVPKVAQNTVLHFDFDKTYSNATTARFEFLSNYGSKETVVGKLQLYVYGTQQTPQTPLRK